MHVPFFITSHLNLEKSEKRPTLLCSRLFGSNFPKKFILFYCFLLLSQGVAFDFQRHVSV